MVGRYKKPSLGTHAKGRVNNPYKTFGRAYNFVKKNPGKQYKTVTRSQKGIDFTAKAYIAKQGKHIGKKVIRFESINNKRRVYAYKCCWGCKTNCYGEKGTHIKTYTEAIK